MSLAKRVVLLRLRKSLAIGEAAYIVQDKLGGMWGDAVSLLTEAINAGDLRAETTTRPVGLLITTVATIDFLPWLEGIARDAPVANVEPEKFGASGTDEDDVEPRMDAATTPPPASREEIEAAFPVRTWGDKLQKAPSGKYKWLDETWIKKGTRKPGDATTYNPVAIAVALIEHKDLTYATCDKCIKRHFPAWCDEWESKAEYLKY